MPWRTSWFSFQTSNKYKYGTDSVKRVMKCEVIEVQHAMESCHRVLKSEFMWYFQFYKRRSWSLGSSCMFHNARYRDSNFIRSRNGPYDQNILENDFKKVTLNRMRPSKSYNFLTNDDVCKTTKAAEQI